MIVPKSGVVAGVYVQAISAYAPHPNAAKLWLEHLYSDEGQIGWLKGYCHPIRFNNLVETGKAPATSSPPCPPRRATPRRSSRPSTSRRRPRRSSPTSGTPSSARRSRSRRHDRTRASERRPPDTRAIRGSAAPRRADARPPNRRRRLLRHDLRARPPPSRPPSRLGRLARRRAVLRVRRDVPDRADGGPARRRLPGSRRRLHFRQHRAARPAVDPALLFAQPRNQRRLGRARRAARAAARARGAPRRPAGLGAPDADDLQRRRLQFRRRAARLRLHGDARAARPRHHAPAQSRLRPLRPRVQHPDLLGPHAHLSLFPDPADGPGRDAGDRRPEARVGGSGAKRWARAPCNTGG